MQNSYGSETYASGKLKTQRDKAVSLARKMRSLFNNFKMKHQQIATNF